ncbi:MAG: GYF domain-containing protein [Bacteroidales bacterium]|nr:GYF domain-containing protein [Bacteroidales bacterium]
MKGNYYYLTPDVQQKGPYTETELLQYITPETSVWRPGLSDWLPASQVPELMELMSASSAPQQPAEPPQIPQDPVSQPDHYTAAPQSDSGFSTAEPENNNVVENSNVVVNYQQPETTVVVDNGPKPDDYKTFSIVMLVLSVVMCSPLGIILSIIALTKANKSREAWDNGDYQTSHEASTSSKKLCYWSLGILAAAFILNIIRFSMN